MSSNQVQVRGIFDGTCRMPVPVPIPVPRRKPGVVGSALAMVFGFALMAGSAHAQAYQDNTHQVWRSSRWITHADGRLVDVQLEVQGQSTPLYPSPHGDARLYFQAFQGRNYGIRLTNQTRERVAVLLTVDGLNVIDGNRSAQSNREPMYVLDPLESTVISGWRTSLDEIRRFVFVDEQRSYAERTGQGNGDLGWIRVTTFREAGRPKYRPQTDWNSREDRDELGQRQDSKAGAESAVPVPQAELHSGDEARAPIAGNESAPGTGWGDRRTDVVNQTDFRPVAQASDAFVLRYEYASGLRALGISPFNGSRVRDRDRGQYGFAQPPIW
jgi:hypothetical protein